MTRGTTAITRSRKPSAAGASPGVSRGASASGRGAPGAPATFAGLTRLRPLRPIRDDADLEDAGRIIERLAGFELNQDQEDYLEALSTLIEGYEARHHPIDLSGYRGVRALKALMEDQGMSGNDLAALLGIHKGHASKILAGERSLTTGQIRALCDRFKVRAELFI